MRKSLLMLALGLAALTACSSSAAPTKSTGLTAINGPAVAPPGTSSVTP